MSNTTETTTEAISWRDLIVTDSEGDTWDDLGEIVRQAPGNLDNAEIENGKIVSWDGFFLAAPGEEADWDTPKAPVNWDGFEDALNINRG